jgi:5'-nucleotidase
MDHGGRGNRRVTASGKSSGLAGGASDKRHIPPVGRARKNPDLPRRPQGAPFRARRLAVKWMVPAGLAACVVVAVGCNANKKTSTAAALPPVNQAVLNVPAAPPAQYTPPAVQQPVVYDAPQPVQPAPAAAAIDSVAMAEPAANYAPAPDPAPVLRSSARSGSSSHRSKSSSVSGRRYTIRKGDSLWSIAEAKYGNGNKWKLIAKANPKVNPNHILAGTTIVLP